MTVANMQREGDKTREAYGRNTTGQSMLLAHQLVEAGSTFVTIRVGGWDVDPNQNMSGWLQ